jgi:hypothetical protein
MEETYPLGLAILDFIPSIAFGVGGYFLTRLAILVRGRQTALVMGTGALLGFLGGATKTTWKLLYTLGIADIKWLGEIQFALLAPGFLLMLIASIQIARQARKEAGVLPVIAVWKIPLMAIMTLCSLGFQGILTYVSFRREVRLAGALFIISVLCMFTMSSMAGSLEQTVANQWIEEGVNSAGQTAFAFASYFLHRNFQLDPDTYP